jgi:Holliday junction resolvase RusA-like endonuclease
MPSKRRQRGMAEAIRFTVRGIPVPKARARTVMQGGRAHSYTPEATKAWEQAVQWAAKPHRPESPLTCPLAVAMVFYLPKPKRGKRQYPSVRPDIDNYAKAILDALNGVMWADDGQIVQLTVSKSYGEPRVEIEIQEVS